MQKIDQKNSEIEQLRLENNNLNKRLKKIQENEEKFRFFFETIPIGVVYQSKSGEIIAANQAAENILGMTIDQMQGRTSMDPRWKAVHEDFSDFPGETHPSMIALKTGKSVKNKIMGVFNPFDSKYHWININAVPQFKSGKIKPFMVYATFEDISERVESKENILKEQQFTERVINAQRDTFFVFEPSTGKAIRWNHRFRVVTGYSDQEISNLKAPDSYYDELDLKKASDAAENIKNKGETIVEMNIITKDGKRIPFEYSGTSINDDKGAIKYIISIGRDISERQKAEEAIKESERSLKKAQVLAQIGHWKLNPENMEVSGSDVLFQIFGLTQNDANLDAFVEVVHPDDREYDLYHIRRGLEQGINWDIEHRIICKDGKEKWVHAIGEVIKDESGKVSQLIGTVQDITERKISEEQLKFRLEFEELIRYISAQFIHIPLRKIDETIEISLKNIAKFSGAVRSSLFIASNDLKRITNSHEWCEDPKDSQKNRLQDISIDVFGYYMNILKKNQNVVISSDEDLPEEAHNERNYAKEHGFRSLLFIPIFRSDKFYGTLGFYGQVGKIIHWKKDFISLLSIVSDIIMNTLERKKTESKLLESEERYRTISEQALMAIIIIQDGIIRYINEAFSELFGYSWKEVSIMKSKDILELFHPEDRQFGTDLLRKKQSVIPKGVVARYPLRIITKSGNIKWIEIYSKTVIYEGKTADLAMYIDITEQKRAEIALLESEERYRLLVENMSDGLGAQDKNGVLTYVNNRFCEILGYSRSDLIGMHTIELLSKSDRPNFESLMTEKRIGSINPYEVNLINKNGDTISILISPSPIFDVEGNLSYAFAVITDITERKKLEEEFFKNQKIESIGLLAGGIAHDFNNILTAILGNISLTLTDIDQSNKNYSYLLDAEVGALRAKELTKQLLTFSKGGAPIKKLISLDNVISESARFALHGSSVGLSLVLSNDIWAVNADRGQIGQVIQNLILNSIQAMNGKGTITISGKNKTVTHESNTSLKPGNYVEIAVMDTGCGIDEKILPNIFDLYFTTKSNQIDAGSGIGLAVCYSIIKKHEGIIIAESVVNKGSKFTIFLPAQLNAVFNSSRNKSLSFSKTKMEYKGRVLVLEDEEAVMKVLISMLNRLNFQVEHTYDGLETISKYKKSFMANQVYDIVILDLTIPGGTGGEDVMKNLIDFDPNIRVIVSSGYSTEKIMSNYELLGFKGILLKPYTISELKEALMSVLKL